MTCTTQIKQSVRYKNIVSVFSLFFFILFVLTINHIYNISVVAKEGEIIIMPTILVFGCAFFFMSGCFCIAVMDFKDF